MSSEHLHSLVNEIGADSVYILMHAGYSQEVRSNRWHFATRWARFLPVVFVAPETPWPGTVLGEEPRIANARILKVVPNRGPLWRGPARIQIAQILNDMERTGARRPILWLYNAFFAEAFCNLPAAARIHHISENYFDYPSMSQTYLDRVKLVSRAADLNVAVSSGCARPLRGVVQDKRLMTATNGADFAVYGKAVAPDPEMLRLKRGFEKLAVFAGVIGDRLDFDLIAEAADALPEAVFVLIGPARLTIRSGAGLKKVLERPNVRKLDQVDPDRLPSIYQAADLGFIPYVLEDWIARNGFPLKALEMAATGLPVVSTLMDPLLPLSPPLVVTWNAAQFIEALRKSARNPEQAIQLRDLAAKNDYEKRFEDIVKAVATLIASQPREPSFARPAGVVSLPALRRYSNAALYDPRAILSALANYSFRFLSEFFDRLPPSLRDRIRHIKRRIMPPSSAS